MNALGVSEPIVQAAGSRHDRIEVQLPGGSSAEAARLIDERFQLVITRWMPDPSIVGGPTPGYRPEPTAMTSDMLTAAGAELDPGGGTSWVVAYRFDAAGTAIYSQLTDATYRATCPQPGQVDCPERRLAFWLDLTPDDVAHWGAGPGAPSAARWVHGNRQPRPGEAAPARSTVASPLGAAIDCGSG